MAPLSKLQVKAPYLSVADYSVSSQLRVWRHNQKVASHYMDPILQILYPRAYIPAEIPYIR